MAIYRQVHTTFWQDSFVLELTPEEKFFYLYLLTNSKTKQCGIYEIPLQIIIIETGYNRDTVIKLIQKFIDYGKVKYDWETNEIALKNWLKYNPYDKNPKIKKCVEKELKSVKNETLIPYTYPMQGVSQQEEEQEEEQKQEEEKILTVWRTTWGRNPSMPEYELFKQQIFDKYGYEKSKRIMKDAELDGFKKLKTLISSLDENGNIKSKDDKKAMEIKFGWKISHIGNT